MASRCEFLRPVHRYNSNIRQACKFGICGAQSDGQVSRRSFSFCTVSIIQPMPHTHTRTSFTIFRRCINLVNEINSNSTLRPLFLFVFIPFTDKLWKLKYLNSDRQFMHSSSDRQPLLSKFDRQSMLPNSEKQSTLSNSDIWPVL